MAENGKVDELIDYLRSLGFEGEKLEADIRRGYEKSKGAFAVRHRIAFDDEMIQYNIRFLFDRMFNAYRLDGYKVIHRDSVVIEHKIINGIDTEALEQSMKKIDWDNYFSRPPTERPDTADIDDGRNLEAIQEVERQLYRLTEVLDFDGQEIQGKLIFKYWSEEFWSDEAVELHSAYGNTMEFKATEYGICNATLAFNIASGRFNDLYTRLSRTGIEQYPGIDLKGVLSAHLSKDSDGFEVSCATQVEDGVISFCIPVTKTHEGYHADTNHAEFTPYPTIQHGVFDGITTQSLEEQIQQIDWEKDGLYTFDELGDVVLLPHIQDIKDGIDRLDAREEAKSIADYLKVRYWYDSFMGIYIGDGTWQMKDWQKVSQRFALEDSTKIVSNLMRGMPIHSGELKSFGYESDKWLVIDLTHTIEDGLNKVVSVKGLTRAQLEIMVNMLPLDGTFYPPDVVRSMQQGEKIPLNLIGIDGKQQVVVSVPKDPKEKRIEVFTSEGRAVPVNFCLDPDWKPSLSIVQKEISNGEESTPKKGSKRVKGLGKSKKA